MAKAAKWTNHADGLASAAPALPQADLAEAQDRVQMPRALAEVVQVVAHAMVQARARLGATLMAMVEAELEARVDSLVSIGSPKMATVAPLAPMAMAAAEEEALADATLMLMTGALVEEAEVQAVAEPQAQAREDAALAGASVCSVTQAISPFETAPSYEAMEEMEAMAERVARVNLAAMAVAEVTLMERLKPEAMEVMEGVAVTAVAAVAAQVATAMASTTTTQRSLNQVTPTQVALAAPEEAEVIQMATMAPMVTQGALEALAPALQA